MVSPGQFRLGNRFQAPSGSLFLIGRPFLSTTPMVMEWSQADWMEMFFEPKIGTHFERVEKS